MAFIKVELTEEVKIMLTQIKKRYKVKTDYEAIIKALLLSSGTSWPIVAALEKERAECSRLKYEIQAFQNSVAPFVVLKPNIKQPTNKN